MRIGIQTGTTGSKSITWLAGNPSLSEREHTSAANLAITPAIAAQTSQRVRAAAARHFDRGNLATSISFTTYRQFSTAQACELFLQDYDRTYPRTGELVTCSYLPDGTPAWRIYAGALVHPPTRKPDGCSLEMGYKIDAAACAVAMKNYLLFSGTVTPNVAGIFLPSTADENGNMVYSFHHGDVWCNMVYNPTSHRWEIQDAIWIMTPTVYWQSNVTTDPDDLTTITSWSAVIGSGTLTSAFVTDVTAI